MPHTPTAPPPQEASAGGIEEASEERGPGSQRLPPGWKPVLSKSGKNIAKYTNADKSAWSHTIRGAWQVHMQVCKSVSTCAVRLGLGEARLRRG